jgi:hypothetical protein
MPRATLLEKAERLEKEASEARREVQKNISMLTHQSERKRKAVAAQREILAAITKPSAHAKKTKGAASKKKKKKQRDDYDDISDSELAEFM